MCVCRLPRAKAAAEAEHSPLTVARSRIWYDRWGRKALQRTGCKSSWRNDEVASHALEKGVDRNGSKILKQSFDILTTSSTWWQVPLGIFHWFINLYKSRELERTWTLSPHHLHHPRAGLLQPCVNLATVMIPWISIYPPNIAVAYW